MSKITEKYSLFFKYKESNQLQFYCNYDKIYKIKLFMGCEFR